jgi:hypothetical protein
MCTVFLETELFINFCSLVFCSPEMPENEATFAITAGGIGDAKE